MMTTTTLEMREPAQLEYQLERPKNPWVSDHVLLTLSVWWVRNTQPMTPDFTNEVATMFDSLQRDLR
jgi:hypothetical protein